MVALHFGLLRLRDLLVSILTRIVTLEGKTKRGASEEDRNIIVMMKWVKYKTSNCSQLELFLMVLSLKDPRETF